MSVGKETRRLFEKITVHSLSYTGDILSWDNVRWVMTNIFQIGTFLSSLLLLWLQRHIKGKLHAAYAAVCNYGYCCPTVYLFMEPESVCDGLMRNSVHDTALNCDNVNAEICPLSYTHFYHMQGFFSSIADNFIYMNIQFKKMQKHVRFITQKKVFTVFLFLSLFAWLFEKSFRLLLFGLLSELALNENWNILDLTLKPYHILSGIPMSIGLIWFIWWHIRWVSILVLWVDEKIECFMDVDVWCYIRLWLNIILIIILYWLSNNCQKCCNW